MLWEHEAYEGGSERRFTQKETFKMRFEGNNSQLHAFQEFTTNIRHEENKK